MVLIYEYLENGSLESHLFGVGQSSGVLNWARRYEIIKGIARGLTYLHEDSQIRTIHRDLKPANILLDRDMIPKISDFGLARIFGRSETESNTTHPVGTRYSTQSDVFSFGLMVLEILTGKQNSAFSYLRSDTNFLSFVWKNCRDGNWREIIDDIILDSSPIDQVQRCTEIGLHKRPLTGQVCLL